MSAAGCTADLKGGTWGNFQQALALEDLALIPAFGALGLSVAAPLFLSAWSLLVRILGAITLFFVTGTFLLLGGISIELNGTYKCDPEYRAVMRSNTSLHTDATRQ